MDIDRPHEFCGPTIAVTYRQSLNLMGFLDGRDKPVVSHRQDIEDIVDMVEGGPKPAARNGFGAHGYTCPHGITFWVLPTEAFMANGFLLPPRD